MDNEAESFEDLLKTITPEVHAKFKQAIELGRWENGDRLSKQQIELCLQAVIAYDELHLKEDEKIGYIDRTKLQAKINGQETEH